MLKALLLDLDDTLLINPISSFLPAYFELLSRHLASHIPPQLLTAELRRGIKAMQANDGTGPTNEQAFASSFYPAVGIPEEDLRPVFMDFYATEFVKLRGLTKPMPEARELIEWAFGRGLQVVVATNPVFPLIAIEERLEWAGLPAGEFAYALITSYEVMHAAKPSPAYYQEIVDRLGRRPEECLAAGDDWEMDVEPAASIGIPVYWVADPAAEPPSTLRALVGQGTLPRLCKEIKSRSWGSP